MRPDCSGHRVRGRESVGHKIRHSRSTFLLRWKLGSPLGRPVTDETRKVHLRSNLFGSFKTKRGVNGTYLRRTIQKFSGPDLRLFGSDLKTETVHWKQTNWCSTLKNVQIYFNRSNVFRDSYSGVYILLRLLVVNSTTTISIVSDFKPTRAEGRRFLLSTRKTIRGFYVRN